MIDVHIIQHPTQDRRASLDALLGKLKFEPVRVHLIDGVKGHIGEGRYRGFNSGASPLVSFIDDDDDIVPGIFDEVLECFNEEPRIDGVCTREAPQGGVASHRGFGYRWKYYHPTHFRHIHHVVTYRRTSVAPHLDYIRGCPTSSEHTLTALMMLDGAIIRHLPKIGYIWNIHEGSVSNGGLVPCEKSQRVYARLHGADLPGVEGQEFFRHRGAGKLTH